MGRFTTSAEMVDDGVTSGDEFVLWLKQQREEHPHEVTRIPFADLDGWDFDGRTGNLAHRSGRFFTIEGVRVQTDHATWEQPIIDQPEIGILGILVKEFGGVLHCLIQAKAEPGNPDGLQLCPTVQATRSNYTGAHGGRAVPYLEYFRGEGGARTLVDSLQSEQTSWFLGKRNRNVVVEVSTDVPLLEGFCWLTIGQLHQLLLTDNRVNMDTRTVLSCIPFGVPGGPARGDAPPEYREGLLRSMAPAAPSLHTDGEVLGWLTEIRARREFRRRVVPLADIGHWHRSDDEIAHDEGTFFRVIAVDVRAGNREVTRWTQPLLAPVGPGRVTLLVRRIGGVLHLLLQARSSAGVFDLAELAPTVQYRPGNYAEDPPFAGFCGGQTRYDTVQSEEGGRFHHALNRYQIIEIDDEVEAPEGFRWLTVHQVTRLLEHGNYVNVEMRSLLAGLHVTW
ncbi:NDP-hexose 2,3-dehydratase family protein [Kineosporia sp. NBRC 101731]|uniref:NDP-hexose 2,3-dehydratase family protein n=1 Tax=Kineosporia sp. NBRC 101731 TaxID=3032199 RepID=UPI0024A5F990|nr:NDP-hexose 2,3-dehydratase family protein [Kineosporia sp. NBRC 101731]GLY32471.1 NDP-hexose 2,3-dehydratase [Kineosporia sp. NBRC 101731]